MIGKSEWYLLPFVIQFGVKSSCSVGNIYLCCTAKGFDTGGWVRFERDQQSDLTARFVGTTLQRMTSLRARPGTTRMLDLSFSNLLTVEHDTLDGCVKGPFSRFPIPENRLSRAWGLPILRPAAGTGTVRARLPRRNLREVLKLSELHWAAVPLLMLFLSGLLIWGLRKHPRATRDELAEILSDDPEGDDSVSARPLDFLSPELIQDRRLLVQQLGGDTPDLLVAFWSDPARPQPFLLTFQQGFLPLSSGIADALADLENRLFDEAETDEVPPGARLAAAYSFVHLQSHARDLLIQSTFAGDHFDHHFFLIDGDGKLSRLQVEMDTAPEILLSPRGHLHREALSMLSREENTSVPRECFLRLLEMDFRDASAHAWLAHLGAQEGEAASESLRRLSLALEFAGDHLIARLESAQLRGADALAGQVKALRREIAQASDHVTHTGYLLAQSLMVLRQGAAARALCQLLLAESPRHPGANRLLRLLDRRGVRGEG